MLFGFQKSYLCNFFLSKNRVNSLGSQQDDSDFKNLIYVPFFGSKNRVIKLGISTTVVMDHLL